MSIINTQYDTLLSVKRTMQFVLERDIQGTQILDCADLNYRRNTNDYINKDINDLCEKISVNVTTLDGEKLMIEVRKSDTIVNMKGIIGEKIGNECDELRLLYAGVILWDDDCIGDYHIGDNSVINTLVRLRGGFLVYANIMNSKSVSLEVSRMDRIIDIKMNIEEKTGLDYRDMICQFQGINLEDNKTVNYYNIDDKSVINVVTGPRGRMKIFAKTMYGKTVALEVSMTDRIIDIKKMIQEKIGLSPDEQKLVYQGEMLEDDETVDDYEIDDKSVIIVVTRPRGRMKIFAKTMDGKTVAFEVSMTDTIIDIKKKIQEKIGLSPDEQKLVYQGGILKDYKTVHFYNIVENSVINVVARPRGSIQIFAKTKDGKTLRLEVTKTERIIDVKKKIHDKMKLSNDSPKLEFRGQLMRENDTVEMYEIVENSVVDVIIVVRIKIFIRTVNGDRKQMEVSEDSIEALKLQIAKDLDLPEKELELIYGNRRLDNDRQMNEYMIRSDDTIDVFVTWQRKVLLVTMPNGKTAVFEPILIDRVRDLKERIRLKTGFNMEQRGLTFMTQILKDDDVIGQCGLSHKSRLYVTQ